jgi:hypothetical protein
MLLACARGPCFLKIKARGCKKRQSFSLLEGKVPIIKNFFISNLNYLFKIKQNIKKLPPASLRFGLSLNLNK